ncbi:hypothetical protein NQ314_012419 [Rhamnusium bicolor]|uniref:DUF5641 domain-containing protein n=1 Tax=Rhamnusium bicolor TaxID=1586634 RepID=A0AAV8XBK2_9CUCU|nr:hypothetical protein NQ314_012419 [Rhamnusium bicolor]
MYRQVLITPEHRHLQNILWRDNPDNDLKCIELQTVTYGTNSAPFLATRALVQLANDNISSHPLASRVLLEQCYVDDILAGSDTFEGISELYKEVVNLLGTAGFQLHKWVSNFKTFSELEECLGTVSNTSEVSNHTKSMNGSKDLLGNNMSQEHDNVNQLDALPEQKVVTHVTMNQFSDAMDIFARYSKFHKLQRTIAYCLRFVNNCSKVVDKLDGPLSVMELKHSLEIIVRCIQGHYFSNEIADVRANVPLKSGPLVQLSPFLDDCGILRVAGRLSQSSVSFSQKHPMILPGKNHVVKLLYQKEHNDLHHAGAQTVLAHLRLRFWPINGLRQIKREIKNCITCFSLTAFPEHDLSQIPDNRLTLWQHCNKMRQFFWERWSVEFLNRLQHRPKWAHSAPNIEINDMVLIKEPNLPPLEWRLGRVLETFKGKDNKVRVAKVRTQNGVYVRPITKLCPLPFSSPKGTPASAGGEDVEIMQVNPLNWLKVEDQLTLTDREEIGVDILAI